MPVAKTYMNYEILSPQPFKDNNKLYVNINFKGKEKRVRWYTDSQWQRLYGDCADVIISTSEAPLSNLKKALGFDKGYITIFKGDQASNNDWFKLSNARYHRLWNWYIVSTEAIPENIPMGIEPVQLKWEDITFPTGVLKTDKEISSRVDQLLYNDSASNFVGDIGDRIEIDATITKAIPLEGVYGISTMHIMEDSCQNIFVWITSSKSLNVMDKYKLRGTVKEHKVYRGVQQTVLSRCIIL